MGSIFGRPYQFKGTKIRLGMTLKSSHKCINLTKRSDTRSNVFHWKSFCFLPYLILKEDRMLSSNKARCNTRLLKPNLEILLWLKQFKENKFPEEHHALDMVLRLFNTLKFQILSTESDDGQSCEVITWVKSSCSQVFTAAYKKTPIMSLLNIIAGLRPTKTPPQMFSYGFGLIFQNTFFVKAKNFFWWWLFLLKTIFFIALTWPAKCYTLPWLYFGYL